MRSQSTLAIVFAALLTLTPHAASAAESVPVSTTRQADTPASCAPAPTGDPITITGSRQVNSAPFGLGGGAYRVDWSMTQPSNALSFVYLDDATTGRLSNVILNASDGKAGGSGQTYLYGIKPGTYYLDVRAPGDWSVTLTPFTP